MKLEINMIVKDAYLAGNMYQEIFNVDLISQTNYENINLNETLLNLSGVEVRLLNENVDYGLFAPDENSVNTIGLNLIVDNIEEIVIRAEANDSVIISPITEYETGKKNAVIRDKFNYIWVLNQVEKG